MEIFPAIDLRDGQAVRLTQGDFKQSTTYSDDPVELAARMREQGAKNLHVVDLDGALAGAPKNAGVVRRIAETGFFLQVGGGIRDEARISACLGLGVNRVILGTIAVEDFAFLERMVNTYGDAIAVSVDARDKRVATRGWTADSGLDAASFCKRLERAGVKTIIYTDISRDGLLQGTNLDAYRELSGMIDCDIVASGGISSLGEIEDLRAMNLYGAIVGKALYEGALSLAEVLSC